MTRILLDGEEILEVRRHARRIVTQSRAHADRADTAAREGFARPTPGTPAHRDAMASREDAVLRMVLSQNSEQLASLSYGILSCLESLELHLKHDNILVVPIAVVARSLLEQAATAAWVLDASASTELRASRSAASLVRAMQLTMRSMPDTGDDNPSPDRAAREHLLARVVDGGGQVVWRKHRSTGEDTDEVSRIGVGSATVPVSYNATQRIDDFLKLGWAYGMLSGIAHGEQLMLHSSSASPRTYLGAVAITVWKSVEAWGDALHSYVGAEGAPFVNQTDLDAIAVVFQGGDLSAATVDAAAT